MIDVNEDEFRLIFSQWRDKKSVIHTWVLYPDDRMRQFSCVVQEISEGDIVLVTEDGWLRVFPFGAAKFSYDTPDNAPPAVRASAAKKINSVMRIDWSKGDMWLMYEDHATLPGAAPVTTPPSN